MQQIFPEPSLVAIHPKPCSTKKVPGYGGENKPYNLIIT